MQRRAFTLIELLVVVAIIALLIAILLPSLGRARDTAKTVRCSSNLKQLYTAMTLYASENEDVILPMEIPTNSFAQGLWNGLDQLGPMFGARRANASQEFIAFQIDKMLDCPSVDHDAAWGGQIHFLTGSEPWKADYTYNGNLGTGTSGGTTVGGVFVPTIPVTFQLNGIFPKTFVKRSQLPRTTLAAVDDREKDGTHDYVFSNDKDLVPPVDVTSGTISNASGATGDLKGEVGIVHKQGKATNMLFVDGVITTDDALKLLPLSPAPASPNWVINWRLPVTTQFPFN